jgi:hypothetical protein
VTTYWRLSMTPTAREIGSLVLHVQGAFLNKPTLHLTLHQAEHEFRVDAVSCQAVLGTLVDAHVLDRTSDGLYSRHFPQAHAA